jgi:hypothetical protein
MTSETTTSSAARTACGSNETDVVIGSPVFVEGLPSPRRIYAVVAPLLVLLILWVYLFNGEGAFKGGPGGRAFAGDYTMFVSAAQVLKSGADPYNPSVLYSAEARMMHRLGRSMTTGSQKSQVRVGNPPLLYWAMRPLTGASFVPAALASLLGLYVLSAVGFLATLRYFGWNKTVLPTFIFLLMPQVVLGAFYGNPIGIVFAAIGLSVPLSRRHPALAGALLSLAWLKPPVALPIVLLLGLFHVRTPRAFAAGFWVASLGLLLLTIVTAGAPSMGLWIHGLLRYSNDMAIQPDVISLDGLYVRWMPTTPRLALESLTLVAAVAVTAYVWKTKRSEETAFFSMAPLWLMWMLASPYGHFFDEILLAVPVVAYLGRNGARIGCRWPGVSLYLLFFSLFFLTWTPFRVYLLPIPLVIVAGLMVRSARDPRFAAA